MDPCDLTFPAAREEIRAGRLSSREVVASCLKRADELDALNAFITRTPELALAAAGRADERRARGIEDGALCGLPLAIKDNLCTRGVQTTCGSKILAGYTAPYDATAVARLLDAGAAPVGKTNMDEFGMGSSSESSAFGRVHNPWHPGRVPGGSSGGSAAAVAAGACHFALGSDTGGSVRQPAAFCSVCGLKPTYGRVSRYGLVAYASSLEVVGPLARDVESLALLCDLLSGADPADATSSRAGAPACTASLEEGVRGMELGLVGEFFDRGLDGEVRAAVERAIAALEQQGARLREVSLPHSRWALPAYYLIAAAEASSNLARYDGVRWGRRVADEDLESMYRSFRATGFGSEVKRRILLGTFALARDQRQRFYARAHGVRELIRRDFAAAFEKVQALVCPTTPEAAFAFGEKLSDPLTMYLADVYTLPANLSGMPALSLPCGFTSGGLPVGLQVIGRPFDEAGVLRIGRAYEREHDWLAARPPREAP